MVHKQLQELSCSKNEFDSAKGIYTCVNNMRKKPEGVLAIAEFLLHRGFTVIVKKASRCC